MTLNELAQLNALKYENRRLKETNESLRRQLNAARYAAHRIEEGLTFFPSPYDLFVVES